MPKKAPTGEQYIPLEMLHRQTGISRNQYQKLVELDPSCAVQQDDLVPVFALIRTCVTALTSTGVFSRQKSSMDDVKLTVQIQHENLIKARIFNQVKLGIFIRKDEATSRILKLCFAIKNMIKNSIKLMAAELPGANRANEIILTDGFNKSVNYLRDNAQILSWEEDGSHYITKTRLDAIQKIDDEAEKTLEELLELTTYETMVGKGEEDDDEEDTI